MQFKNLVLVLALGGSSILAVAQHYNEDDCVTCHNGCRASFGGDRVNLNNCYKGKCTTQNAGGGPCCPAGKGCFNTPP
ncbi:unnamed protein product [Zymoseptoria tritici ST99CH_1A5]|uniref:Uncharacterized protein n=3 Tax=Zymoseptoria tritici TaxID=1047171 RepID=A0A1X7S5N6_ZYMT9|nr:unnamed protein product [Zymoseptoria tritici ST99CH_3D7]SMR59171.1 unnamed protein product [Zymoseptoria tritici ST99CH_1E4]SMR63007.1 unnamed protein product [Zymoseptoria tritici ST99CH_3D1]SMY28380.1 unnamed protein product [Zymoseptoria tritici ST99CH_1A5]